MSDVGNHNADRRHAQNSPTATTYPPTANYPHSESEARTATAFSIYNNR